MINPTEMINFSEIVRLLHLYTIGDLSLVNSVLQPIHMMIWQEQESQMQFSTSLILMLQMNGITSILVTVGPKEEHLHL